MEQMPHHREGIQNDLDKAYDEGHRDDKAIEDEDMAKIRAWDEAWDAAEVAKEARGHMDDKETRGELSLEETVALLKDKGYLDTSFEGKETHRLEIQSLTEEQALDNYKNSGGGIRHSVIKENFPYTQPGHRTLDVMIMKFDKIIRDSDDVVVEMSKLGVRPLTYEELIQYEIANPGNTQLLIALGSKHDHAAPRIWSMGINYDKRFLDSVSWVSRSDGDRFPVVRK